MSETARMQRLVTLVGLHVVSQAEIIKYNSRLGDLNGELCELCVCSPRGTTWGFWFAVSSRHGYLEYFLENYCG